MLGKKYRLPWGIRFDNNRSFSCSFFIAKVKSTTLLFNRFGVIISKKIDKRAVVRNRIKRLMYSIIQELYEGIGSGHDTLFIIRKKAVGAKREDFYLSIKQMLLKEGLLK